MADEKHRATRIAWEAIVKAAKRWRDVVPEYRKAILSHAGDLGPDSVWPVVHAALRGRWSQSTVEGIKREAWKAVESCPPPPDAGKAVLIYELCCAVCEDYEHLLRPLRDHAEDAGWERVEGLGWVHTRCMASEAP